tara:strand:- start:2924 stop:3436 length:513 start_codon:yes stop_codon:yes gene_type:complete
MHNKVHFTFQDSEGNTNKYYVGYDSSKAGSCCGAQILADIHIAYWRITDRETKEGYFTTMAYREITKELKLEAFARLRNYINTDGHIRYWSAGIVMLLDYVKMRGNNRAVFLTREFAEWDDWNTDGLAVKNPNSQFHVQLWTKYLTKVKVNPHYQVSEVVDVTNETLANA